MISQFSMTDVGLTGTSWYEQKELLYAHSSLLYCPSVLQFLKCSYKIRVLGASLERRIIKKEKEEESDKRFVSPIVIVVDWRIEIAITLLSLYGESIICGHMLDYIKGCSRRGEQLKNTRSFFISPFAHVKLMIYLNTCERQEAGSTLC